MAPSTRRSPLLQGSAPSCAPKEHLRKRSKESHRCIPRGKTGRRSFLSYRFRESEQGPFHPMLPEERREDTPRASPELCRAGLPKAGRSPPAFPSEDCARWLPQESRFPAPFRLLWLFSPGQLFSLWRPSENRLHHHPSSAPAVSLSLCENPPQPSLPFFLLRKKPHFPSSEHKKHP